MNHLIMLFIIVVFILCGSCRSVNLGDMHDEGNDEYKKEEMFNFIDIPIYKAIEKDINADLVIPFEKKDIIFLDNSDEGVIGNFRIHDIYNDSVLLEYSNKLYIYKLPEGRFVSVLSHYGQGPEEYLDIYKAFFSMDGESVCVMDGSWRGMKTKIIGYGRDAEFKEKTDLDNYYSDIIRKDNKYIAVNGISYSGGWFKLYEMNDRFGIEKIANLPESLDLNETFNALKILSDDGKHPYVFVKDTLFSVSDDLEIFPIVGFNYGSNGIPKGVVRKNYPSLLAYLKATEKYTVLRDAIKLGPILYCEEESAGKAYFNLFDCENGRILYSRYGKDKSSCGITFKNGDITFQGFPRRLMWRDNILFSVPDYVMAEIFGYDDINSGLLAIPINKFKKMLKSED